MSPKKSKSKKRKPASASAVQSEPLQALSLANERPGREELLILIVILLVGLILRFAYFQEVKQLPDFDHPIMDAGFKDSWARTILTGSTPQRVGVPEIDFDSMPYIRPPLYPFFLASVYLVTGGGYTGVRVVQYMLGLANALLLYLLARRMFGPATALIAAAFMSTYWIFIYFESELNAPALIIFLVLLFFNHATRWTRDLSTKNVIWPAIILGLLALIRTETLLMLPFILGWGWFLSKGKPAVQRAVPLIVFTALVVLTILPVTVRNYVRSGEFVPISTIGGLNLYAGNNPDATGSFPVLNYREMFGISETLSHHNFPQLLQALEKKTGQENLGYADLDRYFTTSAIRYIVTHPVATAKLMVRKALLYWGPWEVSSNKVLYLDKQYSGVLRFMPGFPFVAGLFWTGIAMWLVQRRKPRPSLGEADSTQYRLVQLLLLFIFVSLATHLVFFVVGRFRVPVIPVLLLFGAYGVHGIYRHFAAKKWIPGVGWTACAVALVLFFHIPLTAYSYDLPLWRLQRGTAYGEKGEIDLALRELQEAVDRGGKAPWFYTELGFAHYYKGDYEEAVGWFEKALAEDPHWADAAHKLGLTYMALEQYPQALESLDRAIADDFTAVGPRLDRVVTLVKMKRFSDAETELQVLKDMKANLKDFSYRLGHIAASQGRTEDAIAYFEQAIAENPESSEAFNYLGYEQAKLGRLDEAEANYRQAIDLNPNYTLAYNNLGNLYAHREMYDEATIYYTTALQKDPANKFSDYGLGYVAFQQGDFEAATDHFQAAVSKSPDNAEAHNYLGLASGSIDIMKRQAIVHFKRAIELDPDFILPRNNLGDALEATGDFDGALAAYEGVLERDPNNPYALTHAAALRGRLGHLEKRSTDGKSVLRFP